MNSLVNENTFTCWICQRTLPFAHKDAREVTQSIGFVSSDKGKHCYDCHARLEIAKMIEEGKAVLFFIETVVGPEIDYYITNYPGTIQLDCKRPKFSWHNLAGKRGRRDIDFIGPDGAKWHGVNIGDSQVIHCKRNKKQKKKLTPLKESAYLKPFNYEKLCQP